MWYRFLLACKWLPVLEAINSLPRPQAEYVMYLFRHGWFDVKHLSEFHPKYEHRAESNQEDMYYTYNSAASNEDGLAAVYFEMNAAYTADVNYKSDKLTVFI